MRNKVLVVIVVLVLIIVFSIYIEVNFPKVELVEIVSDKLSKVSEFKIIQVSDYHDSKHGKFVVDNIRKLQPDIVVITGDLMDESTESCERIYSFVEEIMKINQRVYFVSGNHEWRNRNRVDLLQGLISRGVTLLNNKGVVTSKMDNKINICGIDDYYTRHGNLNKAFQGIDENNFTILLSHSPDVVKESKISSADIILSGHTHGGQIRLPLIGAVVAPGQGFFPRYSKGIYKLQGETLLYIDSGLGTSTLPIRLLNRSQMSFIRIKGK